MVGGAAVVGANEGRWTWQVGAYYLDMVWDTFQSVAGALSWGRDERYAENVHVR